MNKITRKIIGGTVIFGCAVFALTVLTHISHKNDDALVPVSLISYENEKPIIILDAGHGESS